MAGKYEVKRVPTGIPGFDKLVEGGLVNNDSYLLAGMPGTGKTIFALQFLWNGATKYNENGLYVSVEQGLEELKRQAFQFGWDFDKLQKKVSFVKVPIDKPDFGILDFVKSEAKKIQAKRIVIDSISVIAINAPMYELPLWKAEQRFNFTGKQITSLPTIDKIKQFIYLFISSLKNIDSTIIFIGESPKETSEFLTRDTVSEFICDGVITFHYSSGIMTGGYERGLKIVKMRGTKHVALKGKNAYHPVTITPQGILIKDLH
jgi:KaiC/GvpD/RAD55 family RecA-like ATPase